MSIIIFHSFSQDIFAGGHKDNRVMSLMKLFGSKISNKFQYDNMKDDKLLSFRIRNSFFAEFDR